MPSYTLCVPGTQTRPGRSLGHGPSPAFCSVPSARGSQAHKQHFPGRCSVGQRCAPLGSAQPFAPWGAPKVEATSPASPRACKPGKRDARSAFPSCLSWLLHTVSTGPASTDSSPFPPGPGRSCLLLPAPARGYPSPKWEIMRAAPSSGGDDAARNVMMAEDRSGFTVFSLSPACPINGQLKPSSLSEVQPSRADVISAER